MNSPDRDDAARDYVLGHSNAEIDRLTMQARLIDPITDCVQLAAGLVATLLPEMERLGIATAADVGLETLTQRMSDEVIAGSSVIFGHRQIAAWSRM